MTMPSASVTSPSEPIRCHPGLEPGSLAADELRPTIADQVRNDTSRLPPIRFRGRESLHQSPPAAEGARERYFVINPVAYARRQFREWWQARLPLSDSITLTQRNVYILPTRPGFM